MIVKCECGFQGALYFQDGVAKCFGCDRLYQEADGKVQPVSNEIPTFKNVDEMMKFAAKSKGGKVTSSNSQSQKPKRTRKRKPAEKDVSSKLAKSTHDVPIYKTIHFYIRPGDSWEQILKDGREEVGYAGSGTLVFVHNHLHNTECNDSCREMS
jgi:hypothetical protein